MSRKREGSPAPRATGGGKKSFFVFRIGSEGYAFPPEAVTEVTSRSDPVAVPFTPAWLDGVVNVRGKILPVVDLLSFFQLPAQPGRKHSRMVVVGSGNLSFAVWSDQIVGVKAVEVGQLQQPLGNLPELLQRCTVAHFRIEDTVVYCLDLESLLRETRGQVKPS